MIRIWYLAMLCTLVACGNADMGAHDARKARTAGAAASRVNPHAAALNPAASFVPIGSCKTMTVMQGYDGATAQYFSGATACFASQQWNLVQVKVSAQMPVNARLCLVPMTADSVFDETCFSLNGFQTVTLNTTAYTAVGLVLESEVGSYKGALRGQTANFPPSAYASVSR